ncbi:Glyoxylase, beta-lactamase superfamily II [Alteribacillus persepolensis]|uniref:Glyoxylase, beta-lactamase superfamily II n=1 Tax=Alteribacillus persepolensis TaxID=568899 RepID=A0A1G8JVZ9_9BACI|nr:MBL fold metallo-hydrolase [Alteribacillus persepolensis]SDI35315.1 Glyoxylase, beta-lactamase superfamily II [Alteribacillus persepolensis]
MQCDSKSAAIFPITVPVDNSLKSFNFYLVQSAETLTLIDAGMNNDSCWNSLLHTLQEQNLSLSDIDQIFLTHHHIDHVGLINRITSECSIPVYAHPYAYPRLKRDETFLQKRIDFFEELYKTADCGEKGEQQVAYLKKAMYKNQHQAIRTEIMPFPSFGHDFTIIDVPGHSEDQVGFFHEPSGVLFAGDLLINHISSNAIIEPGVETTYSYPLLQHMESMKKVMQLKPDVIYSGHGTVIHDAESLIRQRLDAIDHKAEKFLQLISDGYTTANTLAKTYYNKAYDSQFSLVMSEIIGHLQYLENNKRIQKEMTDGVWHYHLT